MQTGARLLEIVTVISTVQGINKEIIVMDPTEAAPTRGEVRESEDREDAKGLSAKEAGESQRSGQPSGPAASVAGSLTQP
jgi:hypothetical protein